MKTFSWDAELGVQNILGLMMPTGAFKQILVYFLIEMGKTILRSISLQRFWDTLAYSMASGNVTTCVDYLYKYKVIYLS